MNYRSDLHSVEICRVHKGSPFNCSAYIPEIVCENREDVIDLKEVDELINKTFGKSLIVNIYTQSETDLLRYEITKDRAIL